VPIPGTTKLHRLEENIAGASVDLSADDLREIDDAASKIMVQGVRYPEKVEQMIDRQATTGFRRAQTCCNERACRSALKIGCPRQRIFPQKGNWYPSKSPL
jgi:hypothetical protein